MISLNSYNNDEILMLLLPSKRILHWLICPVLLLKAELGFNSKYFLLIILCKPHGKNFSETQTLLRWPHQSLQHPCKSHQLFFNPYFKMKILSCHFYMISQYDIEAKYTKNENVDCAYMTLQLDKAKLPIYKLMLHQSNMNKLSLNWPVVLYRLRIHKPACTHT